MSFTAPWSNYTNGDLLYGLHGPRGELAAFLGLVNNYTIDEYDIASAPRATALPLQFDPGFRDALLANGKYAEVVQHGDVGWDLSDNAHWQGGDYERALTVAKRKCKGGLEWIIYNTTRKIHFCLDGMNLAAAASKTYDGLSGGSADAPQGKAGPLVDTYAKPRSITGAEIRWVYRNKLDPRVRTAVQFWRRKVSWAGGVKTTAGWYQCPPPWSDPAASHEVRSAWAAYLPAHPFTP